MLDDAAFGASTPVVPKFISIADPASRWTGANGGLAFFAYSTNYLIDLKHAVIMDVEATTAIRQAEVTAQRRMLERTQDRFGVWPQRLAADAGYGSAENLACLIHERGIEPHIPVFEKSSRTDGTYSRSDFTYDHKADVYICPGGKQLKHYHRSFLTPRIGVDGDGLMRYRAIKADCAGCALKARCCPNAPARKVLRSIHEGARDMARDLSLTDAYLTSRRERKKVEMLFAHLKRILKLDRLRLRAPTERKTSSSSPPPPRTFARWPSCSRPRRRRWRAKATQPRSGSAHANVRFFHNGLLQHYPALSGHHWRRQNCSNGAATTSSRVEPYQAQSPRRKVAESWPILPLLRGLQVPPQERRGAELRPSGKALPFVID